MSASLQGIAILLLEDEPLIAFDVEEELRTEGAEVFFTMNRSAALDAIQNREITFCVLDFLIGDGDCRLVAEECRKRGIPYLITSGVPSQEDVLGCAGWLEKPFSTASVIERIKHSLNTEHRSGPGSEEEP